MLSQSVRGLVHEHDLVMFDLDGVVYVGPRAVDGVADRIRRVREAGPHIAFVTNNAARTPLDVAAHLTELGVQAGEEDVVTSAQAAARLLREEHGAGARVVLLGGDGLEQALRSEDLEPVSPVETGVAAVSGYGKDVKWRDIMRVAAAVRDGLPYVATNADGTVPTSYGVAPGHGVLVKMISDYAGVEPLVAGKPQPPLMHETIRRVGGSRPLMVGDRLDTDIEGAHAIGIESLLVLTGVSGLRDVAAAPENLRPSYISTDLEGLFTPHPVPEVNDGHARLGGWQAEVVDAKLRVSGHGTADDWWRVAASACWIHLDRIGSPADVSDVLPPVPGAVGAGE